MTDQAIKIHPSLNIPQQLFDPTKAQIVKADDETSEVIELAVGQIWNVGSEDDFQPVRIVGFGLSFGETYVEYDWYEGKNRNTDAWPIDTWVNDNCILVAQACDPDAWEKGEFKPLDDAKPLFGMRMDASGIAGAKPKRKHGHYFKDVSFLKDMDIYALCKVFGVKDDSGAKHHAIKKIVCSGNRGAKDEIQDIQEAIDTLVRFIDLKHEFEGHDA